MNYIALYRKYRPQTFEEVVEQQTVVKILKQALKLDKISHAYLFAGPKGSGKTTVARIFSKGLNCVNGPTDKPCLTCNNCKSITNGTSLDVIEIDAASNRGIDEIRELKDKINYVPVNSKFKVYIIDETHMLTPYAFNALLKTLEEPPQNVVFILATTEPDKIPATIMSRCEHMFFKPISIEGLSNKIREVAKNESATIDDEAINLIAKVSSGSLRNSLSLLEQLITLYDDNISVEKVRNLLEIPDENFISNFIDALLENKPDEILSKVSLMKEGGKDAKVFISEIIDYLQDLIIGTITGFESVSTKRDKRTLEIMKDQAKKSHIKKLTDFSSKFIEILNKLKFHKDPFFPIIIASLSMMNLEEIQFNKQSKQEQVLLEKEEVKEEIKKTTETVNEEKIEIESTELSKSISTSLSIEDIKNRWEEIKAIIKNKSSPLHAMLIHVNPVELKEDLLVLDTEKDFFLTMLRKQENIQIIENALKSILGKDIRIAFAEHKEKVILSKEDIFKEVAKKKEIDSLLKLFDGAITDIKDSEEEK